jgi:hypothetical protein
MVAKGDEEPRNKNSRSEPRLKTVTKSGIGIPSSHRSSASQWEITQLALTGKQSHATNSSMMSRVLNVFDSF